MEKRRKTTTSSEVKARWNAKHYDRISIYLDKESAEAYKEMCNADGLSLSEIPKKAILEYLNKK